MSDINLIAEALGQHHSQRALSLTVVSNNKDKFKRLQKAWRFPSIYVAWSPGITAELARLHDISVIPVGLNPFTSCKSPNRAVTSFLNDLAVTASPIPSYSELFAENIETDWHHGLARMMHDVALRQKTISAAKRIIEQRCAVGVIARQWHDFLLPN
ncbi:hypothetical protein JY96_16185 [Aquabacterium sp. NJ1]|nr:hypothetical protein JY96_16185 [Aquabacterium sp. NJ1]